MQAAQQVSLKQYGRASAARAHVGLAAQLSNLLTRVFGCWHSEMSRPFTHDGESYRACLECGARRNFDSSRWEMVGPYYYDAPRRNRSSLGRAVSYSLEPRAVKSKGRVYSAGARA